MTRVGSFGPLAVSIHAENPGALAFGVMCWSDDNIAAPASVRDGDPNQIMMRDPEGKELSAVELLGTHRPHPQPHPAPAGYAKWRVPPRSGG